MKKPIRPYQDHPLYGSNSTIPVCFWCGKARNELVKLGDRYADKAGMMMCVDFKPCPECSTQRAGKTTFIEVQFERRGALPSVAKNKGKDLYATGRWGTIDNIDEMMKYFDPVMQKAITKNDHIYVDKLMFETIFGAGLDGIPPTEVVPVNAS